MARYSNKNRYLNRLRLGKAGLLGLLGMLSGAANAAWQLNLQEPVTATARRVYDLHTL
jgi:hypothetical protein